MGPCLVQISNYLVTIKNHSLVADHTTRQQADTRTNDTDSDNPPRLIHRQPHAVDGPRLVADQKDYGLGHLERRDGWDGFRGPGLEGVDGSVQAVLTNGPFGRNRDRE